LRKQKKTEEKMTTTTIERMPMNWDSGESMGEWEQGAEAAGAAWRAAFDDYLEKNYHHCSLVGNEIYGPATYRFPDANVQADTPSADDLEPLPAGGIYAEFQGLHQDDWCDVIENFIE